MNDRIRHVIDQHAKLAISADSLGDQDDLYKAGMTSHASVGLMLGLEGEFDVEFPDRMLTRAVFQSVASIAAALSELAEGDLAA
jgi:acyl carrier protein